MGAALFPEAFERRGMTIVVPKEEEQEFIHQKYMGELFVGAILDETREALIDITETMKQRNNVDGLILGGTELSLILRESTAASLPVLDTTQIPSRPRSSGCCGHRGEATLSRLRGGGFAGRRKLVCAGARLLERQRFKSLRNNDPIRDSRIASRHGLN